MSKLEKIILKNHLCVGCGLCESLGAEEGITMEFSDEGFLRPKLKQSISKRLDEQIFSVCPGRTLESETPESEQHLYWGPIKTSYTGYAIDTDARYAGSSGGGLSAILIHMLESGKADVVIQTTASEVNPVINATVLSTTKDAVIKSAGSRYAPAAPLVNVIQVLEQYDRVVIVGKPCDIAGVTNLLRKHPELENRVVLKLAFMCGGTPSQFGTDEILSRLDVKHDELASFRYRGEGWPGNVQALTTEGRLETMSYPVSWGEILTHKVQPRCKICADATGVFSDITFADAWYDDGGGMPSFDEQDGRSLVLARTDRGQGIVEEAVAADAIYTEGLAVEEIAKMQPYHVLRKQFVMSRLMALRCCFRPIPSYRYLRLLEAARKVGLKQNFKNFLGMIKRVLLKRA